MPPQLTGALQSLFTTAAYTPQPDRAFLRITGSDATRWLNGMVTNSVQALGPGEGNYNFLLSAQGRIQGDCTIYRESGTGEPSFLLETDTAQLETVRELLDRFIIMDDVELTDAPWHHGLTLTGPQTLTLLSKLQNFKLKTEQNPSTAQSIEIHGAPVLLLSPPAQGLFTCEIWTTAPQALAYVEETLGLQEISQATPDTLEQLRVLEGRPRYGTDIRNAEKAKDLPQETNQAHALHFSKGCYVGQEIVERIRSRGEVHRLFTPFRLEGSAPGSFPLPLEANGKTAGELTSAVPLETTVGPLWLALGYARREVLATGSALQYPGGTATPRAPGKLE